MSKKIISMLGIILVLTVLFSFEVLSFAVSSSYWEGKPATAYPGKTITLNAIRLQNTGGNDEMVKAEISKGEEIIILEKTDYLLKAGTTYNPVEIKIKIPSDAEIGTSYPVTMSFRTITPGSEGGIAMGIGYSTSFDVVVAEEQKIEKANLTWIIAIIAGIILLIAGIVILIIKKTLSVTKT